MATWFAPLSSEAPRFCVVGTPIAHSRSPQIHTAFGAQLGIDLVYEKVEVSAGCLAAAVDAFRACGGRGMNVTVPLKEEACALADRRSERAAVAGAANTLWFTADGRIAVDNTDGAGLVRDLERNHGVVLAGARVLLIGAGGAARGVVPALLQAGPATLTITNRTRARAEQVARDCASGAAEVLDWGAAPTVVPDVVINATSLSLGGEIPPLAAGTVGAHSVCYDMMYAAQETAFVAWARAQGAAQAIDGLGMLVEQAAEAFSIWHGMAPDTAPVIAALRQA